MGCNIYAICASNRNFWWHLLRCVVVSKTVLPCTKKGIPCAADGDRGLGGYSSSTLHGARRHRNLWRKLGVVPCGSYYCFFAPFMALGNPFDWVPPQGAARSYTPDEDWQRHFLTYAAAAVAIVMDGSSSDGLYWELAEIVRNGWQTKLFFSPPQLLSGATTHAFVLFGRCNGQSEVYGDRRGGSLSQS